MLIQAKKFAQPRRLSGTSPKVSQVTTHNQEPQESVTLSGRSGREGWVIAGMSTALFSVPLAIAAKSPAVAVVGVAAGIGLMFGPD